jgi:hypothetical protein
VIVKDTSHGLVSGLGMQLLDCGLVFPKERTSALMLLHYRANLVSTVCYRPLLHVAVRADRYAVGYSVGQVVHRFVGLGNCCSG